MKAEILTFLRPFCYHSSLAYLSLYLPRDGAVDNVGVFCARLQTFIKYFSFLLVTSFDNLKYLEAGTPLVSDFCDTILCYLKLPFSRSVKLQKLSCRTQN